MTDAEQPALFLDTSPRSADGPPRSRTVASDPKRGARLREVHRDQMVWGRIDLGAEVTDDDPVRSIWAIVERLELAALYVTIEARDDVAGAPAIDPKILLALWPVDQRDERRRGKRAGDLAADQPARGVSLAVRRRRGRLPHVERLPQPAQRRV